MKAYMVLEVLKVSLAFGGIEPVEEGTRALCFKTMSQGAASGEATFLAVWGDDSIFSLYLEYIQGSRIYFNKLDYREKYTPLSMLIFMSLKVLITLNVLDWGC